MTGDGSSAGVAVAAAGRRAPGSGTLALLTLVWLAAMVTSARLTIGDTPDGRPLSVMLSALELPQVVAAALVAGVAVAVSLLELLATRADRAPAGRAPAVLRRATLRLAAAAGTGLALGLAVAVPVAIGYADLPYVPVLAGAIGCAALLGGTVAALPARAVAAAGSAGALGAFLVGFAAGHLDADLRTMFGSGESPQSVLAASGWTALAAALVAGVVAGGLAYAYLARTAGRLPWPAYLLAGALPGLLVLATELVARVGAAPLVRLITEASVAYRPVWDYLATVRLNRALVLMFVGAVVAILLLGHLRPGLGPRPTGGADAATRTPGAGTGRPADRDGQGTS